MRARSHRRRETSAGGVVVRPTAEGVHFLLIRDPYYNWGLPKGHVEDDESPQDAALREVAEETGLRDLSVLERLPTIDWHFVDGDSPVHKFCHFFLLESRRGEPEPEHAEGITACEWLPLGPALERITYDNAREVLREAGRRLSADPELST